MKKRKFAVFDIDGTFFRSHLYWEVVLDLARNEKLHPKINELALELHDSWKSRKHSKAFEDFDHTTIVAIDGLIQELDPKTYDIAVKKVLPPILDHTYMYPKTLMKNLKDKGYFTIALSGSRIEEVNIFAKHHGFDDWIGQEYVRTKDGKKYTGEMNKTYKDKHVILKKFIQKHDLTLNGSYAIGDTAGDISMMEMVDNPIAFNPNHLLLEFAQEKGWKVVIERKSIAYTLEKRNGEYVLA